MLPPDMVADGDDDPDTVNADAAAILSTTLIAEAGTGADVKLVIEENGIAIGALTLNVTIGGDGKVRYKTRDATPTGVDDERFTRLMALLVRGAGVNIRYDSGHSVRSEEHTSELQSLMRISSAVFCLKQQKRNNFDRH